MAAESLASRGRHHQDRGEKRRNVLGAAQHRGVQRRGLQRLQGPPRLAGSRDAAGGSTTSPMFRSTATWCTPTTYPLRLLSRAGTAPGGVRGGVPHGHDRPRDGHGSLRIAAPQRAPGWPGVRHRGTASTSGARQPAPAVAAANCGRQSGLYVGRGISLGQRPRDRACTRSRQHG